VPDGVVNQDLIDLIEADYVTEADGDGGRTYSKITNAGGRLPNNLLANRCATARFEQGARKKK